MGITHTHYLLKKQKLFLKKFKIKKRNLLKIRGFLPEVFKRAKKDGNKRMILSLKKCNKVINYKHFQMESIKNVTNLKPHVYLGLIYLKDAFFQYLYILNIKNT